MPAQHVWRCHACLPVQRQQHPAVEPLAWPGDAAIRESHADPQYTSQLQSKPEPTPLMHKPFLIMQLRPENITADSEFAAILKYGGLQPHDTVRCRLERSGLPELDLNHYSAIIVGGSPFDVSTPAELKSTIQRQIESGFRHLFDQITAMDFPFLGACSGNGLLGAYCGAKISRQYAEPVGGVDITLTNAAEHDPLLQGFPKTFRVLVGHKEACDEVPPGATLLAQSASCPVQMFRLRHNIYATQFHPEGDSQEFILRIKTYREHGYFPPPQASQLIASIANEHTPHSHNVLRRFVDRYRTTIPVTARH